MRKALFQFCEVRKGPKFQNSHENGGKKSCENCDQGVVYVGLIIDLCTRFHINKYPRYDLFPAENEYNTKMF